jgi:2-polyprenyl-6-hydroxyphenyl methylase/3-demethylubiquinone-9 3-methyltransferase
VVASPEVIEHVYYPRTFGLCIYDLLEPSGMTIISTSYYGYWRNRTVAASGKLDSQFTELWDRGYIKFRSICTLTTLLKETGLKMDRFIRVGCLRPFAKSMIAIAFRQRMA